MKEINGFKLFGFWKGMPYGEPTDSFEECEAYANSIDKRTVVNHIKKIDPDLACLKSSDLFDGTPIRAGLYEDGPFRFPTDFLRYYEKYDIGIPPEYEEYLKANFAL